MSENLKVILGYILICTIWGSTWLAIRVSLYDFTPLISSGIRFVIAGFLIFVLMKIKNFKVQTDKTAIKIIVYQTFFSFFLPFAFVYWAEQYIESAVASLIFGIFPFSVMLFSRFMIKGDRIEFDKMLSIIMGFIGLIFIFSDKLSMNFSEDIVAVLLVLIGSVVQGWIAVVIKKEGDHLNPLTMNMLPVVFAGILLLLSGLIFEDTSNINFTVKGISAVLYLSVFGTIVAFTIYYWIMKRINVVILSLISFVSPIVSVFLGYFILNEQLSPRILIGGFIIVSGILVANLKGLRNYYLERTRSL